jgi:hypothetical protein
MSSRQRDTETVIVGRVVHQGEVRRGDDEADADDERKDKERADDERQAVLLSIAIHPPEEKRGPITLDRPRSVV